MHASHSLQQFCAAQIEQGVPSLGHTGPLPQKPPLHCAEQHSPAPVQAAPSGRHSPPQVPPTQLPPQQSPPSMHGVPSGWQPLHTFIWQLLLQQLAPLTHGRPLGAQMAPHTPALHTLLQHWPGVVQGAPLLWQSAHTPPEQIPLQHSWLVLQL
jgi:hypothetical protein